MCPSGFSVRVGECRVQAGDRDPRGNSQTCGNRRRVHAFL